jgi:hypothetical protein
MADAHDFLHPRGRYRGEFKPENLMFNANLQEFSQRVTYVCCLETGGKITPEESYREIQSLWKQLKKSRKELGIDKGGLRQNDEPDAQP